MERLTSKREGEKVIRVHGKEQKKGKNTHWTERSERKKESRGERIYWIERRRGRGDKRKKTH